MRVVMLSQFVPRMVAALFVVIIATPLGAAEEPECDGTSFVGLPVYANDGAEVGEVVGETKGTEGLPEVLRIAVAQKLGLGVKTVEVARDRYVGLRGAVTLDYVADEVEHLPAASQ